MGQHTFERLNGILGAFKTNSHDISIQLMRRFLNSSDSSLNCWPAEFRKDFTAMVEKPSYTKGSLAHLSLPSLLGQSAHTLQEIIQPLAPAYEDAFEPHLKSDVEKAVAEATHEERVPDVLSLFLRCKAVKVGKYILGSKDSRFSTSLFKVRTTEYSTSLAEVQYYAKCTTIIDQSDMGSKKQEVWIAGVSLFASHTCQMWFGKPCEVWPAIPSSDLMFVTISFIVSRVAYCKCSMNFWSVYWN